MTNDEIRARVLGCVSRVAPEVDAAAIRPDGNLREAADLDSVDFLNFIIELHRALGVDVPESAYGEFATLDSAVTWIAAAHQAAGVAPP